jgi:hypothetical protein
MGTMGFVDWNGSPITADFNGKNSHESKPSNGLTNASLTPYRYFFDCEFGSREPVFSVWFDGSGNCRARGFE